MPVGVDDVVFDDVNVAVVDGAFVVVDGFVVVGASVVAGAFVVDVFHVEEVVFVVVFNVVDFAVVPQSHLSVAATPRMAMADRKTVEKCMIVVRLF